MSILVTGATGNIGSTAGPCHRTAADHQRLLDPGRRPLPLVDCSKSGEQLGLGQNRWKKASLMRSIIWISYLTETQSFREVELKDYGL